MIPEQGLPRLVLDEHDRGFHFICLPVSNKEISVITTASTTDLRAPNVDNGVPIYAVYAVNDHYVVSELDSAPGFFFGRPSQLFEFQAVTAEKSFVPNKSFFPKHLCVWLKLG